MGNISSGYRNPSCTHGEDMKPKKQFARAFLPAISLLCAIIFCVPRVSAQFDTATVLGTIKDSTGAVVPGVTVTLKNIDTGIIATTQSDEGGDFQFVNVKIGNYRVSAEKQGFSIAVAERVNVTVNARQRVDLTLQPGALTENVVVTARVPSLEAY